MLKKILLSVFIVLILAGAGFVAWASATNPVMPAATEALKSDAQVKVTTGGWLVFEPVGKPADTGLIFYPGGKVDYRAYAPYANAIARQGYLVVIQRMPLNLAVFDINEAGKVMQAYPQIKTWAVGGHSLGGSMAANYAAHHTDQVRGLVLLASYPASSDSLVGKGVQVLSIFATNDGLATQSKIDAARPLLPGDTTYVAIQGGNHGQFGYYGQQSGDGVATIARADQQVQAIDATVAFLRSLSKK